MANLSFWKGNISFYYKGKQLLVSFIKQLFGEKKIESYADI